MDTSSDIVWLKVLSRDDIDFTRTIRNANADYFHSHEEISDEDHRRWFDSIVCHPRPAFHIIMLGGVKIGTVSILGHLDGIFDIGNVVIEEEFRGKGYGTKAMHIAMGLAISRGAKKIQLSVVHNNYKACRFYEALGFSEKAIIMERSCL